METIKEEKKAEWKQQYQKRKDYFKQYYQKNKETMDANNKKNAKKYREAYKSFREGKKAEGIIFFLEKASDWNFKGEVEIKNLDDLLKFIKKNGPIIVRNDLWYISDEDKKKYKYGIKIYDSWVE